MKDTYNRLTEEDLTEYNRWRSDLMPCEISHDGHHHFPLNVQTGLIRKDCVECGRTKKEIVFHLLNKGKEKRRREGDIPRPGKFPRPKDPNKFPKPK